MILDNPFKVLGLPATAASREVRRRFDELAVRASLGAAPVGLAPESLSRIRQSLEDAVQRLTHEVYWLHSSPEIIDPTLDLTASSAATDAAIVTLRSAAGRPPSLGQAVSLHDLAVVTFARFESASDVTDPSEPLALWASVHASEGFWHYLKGRAAEAGDARLTGQVVDRERAELPRRVLEPIAARASALVDANESEAAATLVRAIRRSGLPADSIETAARESVASIRVRILEGARALDEVVRSVPSSEVASSSARASLATGEALLVGEVLAPFFRLRVIDPVLNDGALADGVAAAARRLSVSVCNALGDLEGSYALIRLALEVAQTPGYLAELAGDQARVLAIFHDAGAGAAARARDAALVAAHLELALPYARSDEERVEWANMASGARRSERLSDSRVEAQKQSVLAELERREEVLRAQVRRASGVAPLVDDGPAADIEERPVEQTRTSLRKRDRPRRGQRRHGRAILAGAAAALAVAGIAIASTQPDSSGGAQPALPAVTPPPAESPDDSPPPSENPPPNTECSRLDALDSSTNRLKREIAAKKRQLARIEAQEAPLDAALNKIDRDYPSNELPPDVWRRYVPLRDQFKKLEARADRVARTGNRLVRRYNADVRAYNRLLKEC